MLLRWTQLPSVIILMKMPRFHQRFLRWDMLIFKITILFLMTVLIIFLIVLIWSTFYISREFILSKFHVVFSTFVLSIILLLLGERLLFVFLGWEGLGVTSVALIVFYQNWRRANGGTLTLITNRLGDRILLLILSTHLVMQFFQKTLNRRMLMLWLARLTLTKRAQWPFSSWLPAAIAAPTPVSALVHSSTLVTAGVWLLLRFGRESLINYKIWLILGIGTMVVARLAALIETDAKKVVALSTLSQLGVMFIRLTIGNKLFRFFHILNHAFAKANLFIVIGSLLHFHFSSQDVRNLNLIKTKILLLSGVISIYSLTGALFSSGFVSKEWIISLRTYSLNRSFAILFFVILVSLTLAYCIKLLLLILRSKPLHLIQEIRSNLIITSPSMWLRLLRLISGILLGANFRSLLVVSSTYRRVVWLLLGLRPVLTIVIAHYKNPLTYGFTITGKFVFILNLRMFTINNVLMHIERTLERRFLFNLSFTYSRVLKLLTLITVTRLLVICV